MNKALKIILISSIAIFGVGFLLIPSSFAQAKDLNVQFEQTPLFDEANFLPGYNITRWVKVTNNSSTSQKIAAETIKERDPDNLASQMNIIIKEGATTLYNDTLASFFAAGEVFLSNLAGNSAQTQYDFIVTFDSATDNPYQGKSLGFDLLVGFQGTEGGGGGGGGFLPPGLTIAEESIKVIATAETSVTIIWTTSYSSTSQVIYAAAGETHTLDLTDNAGIPPKYGYAHTTLEYDTSPKVTDHSVTITGLTPGTTYYFRSISHASLAVSYEYSFTTKGVAGGMVEEREEGKMEEKEKPLEEVKEELEGKIPPEEEIKEETPKEEKRSLGEIFAAEGLLAAIGAMPFNLRVILIIGGIIIIGLIILRIIRKKKIKS